MGICMKLWYASFSKVFRRWQVLTIFLHRYASLDTKVRPRFDGDRVYVHDSIVLTVIGGSTHVTHSMFVTFWRDKRGFMYLHVMSSWWDFGLKTMQHTHDLWILVIHPDSWYLYRTTLNLQQCCSAVVHGRIALKNLPGDYISMTSRAFRRIVSKPSGFSNDVAQSQALADAVYSSCQAWVGRTVCPVYPVFPIIEVQTCLEGCAVSSMKCS